MRASQVRALIVTAIEAVAPDKKAGQRHALRHVELKGRPAGSLADRNFTVELGSPPRRQAGMLPDTDFVVGYELLIHYAPDGAVEDRMAEDTARIDIALRGIPHGQPEVSIVQHTWGAIARSDDGRMVVPCLVDVTYLQTGVL